MQINELTGLPELPEGHFWRVQEYSMARYFEFATPPTSFGFFVELVEKTTFIKPAVKSFLMFEWHSGTYEESKETAIVSEQLKMKDKPARLEEITEKIILEAAKKAYDRWEQMERGRSLLGDYPPKKLKAVTDDEDK